jgi:hypothetical protein
MYKHFSNDITLCSQRKMATILLDENVNEFHFVLHISTKVLGDWVKSITPLHGNLIWQVKRDGIPSKDR